MSEIFNISKANSADLCYTLSSFCSSKASEQHRTEQSGREGTFALKRLQRKTKPKYVFLLQQIKLAPL